MFINPDGSKALRPTLSNSLPFSCITLTIIIHYFLLIYKGARQQNPRAKQEDIVKSVALAKNHHFRFLKPDCFLLLGLRFSLFLCLSKRRSGIKTCSLTGSLLSLRFEKHSLQYTGRPPLGLKGTSHSFLHSAQIALCITLSIKLPAGFASSRRGA